MQKIIQWSKTNHYTLPWRSNRSLYKTLVSEIMLQQTTVGTVLSRFPKFIKLFPTIKSLARAKEDKVTLAWEGLGYYRRARNLHKAAKEIVNLYDGKIPLDYNLLVKIPGIGDYTASAILGIGDDQKILAIDTNLERVLSRLYGIKSEKGTALKKEIKALFDSKKIFNDFKGSFCSLNESLMDIGRVFCQSKEAHCLQCPLRKRCFAFKNKKQSFYPVIKKVQQSKETLLLLRFVVTEGNKYYFRKREKKEWLEGQWEFPTYVVDCSDKKFSQYPLLPTGTSYKVTKEINSSITKYKITNQIVELKLKDFKKNRDEKDLLCDGSDLHLSSITKKILKNQEKV